MGKSEHSADSTVAIILTVGFLDSPGLKKSQKFPDLEKTYSNKLKKNYNLVSKY